MSTDKVFDDLRKLPTLQDVLDFYNSRFPGWIIDILDEFSNDYPHLNKNWDSFCSSLKPPVSRKKIFIVKKLETEYEIAFAELLTTSGFIVREMCDFNPCPKCARAVPTKQLYFKMISKHTVPSDNYSDIPKEWKKECLSC